MKYLILTSLALLFANVNASCDASSCGTFHNCTDSSDTCVVDCTTGSQPCQNLQVIGPFDNNVQITCSRPQACNGLTVTAQETTQLVTVSCTSGSSCRGGSGGVDSGITIIGAGASNEIKFGCVDGSCQAPLYIDGSLSGSVTIETSDANSARLSGAIIICPNDGYNPNNDYSCQLLSNGDSSVRSHSVTFYAMEGLKDLYVNCMQDENCFDTTESRLYCTGNGTNFTDSTTYCTLTQNKNELDGTDGNDASCEGPFDCENYIRYTTVPTSVPSMIPSTDPTAIPSMFPSNKPSLQPTVIPTDPTSHPTEIPSIVPTEIPSNNPSNSPTENPSGKPSIAPSKVPSNQPTTQPSQQPTIVPSLEPTNNPTSQPSIYPTEVPSSEPSNMPTELPSDEPTVFPSEFPTDLPTIEPSDLPTELPSDIPSYLPTVQPTNMPTQLPSSEPSNLPSIVPTQIPSYVPTTQPTNLPTNMPVIEENISKKDDEDQAVIAVVAVFSVLVGICVLIACVFGLYVVKLTNDETYKDEEKYNSFSQRFQAAATDTKEKVSIWWQATRGNATETDGTVHVRASGNKKSGQLEMAGNAAQVNSMTTSPNLKGENRNNNNNKPNDGFVVTVTNATGATGNANQAEDDMMYTAEDEEDMKAEEYVTPGGPDLDNMDLNESDEDEAMNNNENGVGGNIANPNYFNPNANLSFVKANSNTNSNNQYGYNNNIQVMAIPNHQHDGSVIPSVSGSNYDDSLPRMVNNYSNLSQPDGSNNASHVSNLSSMDDQRIAVQMSQEEIYNAIKKQNELLNQVHKRNESHHF